MHRFTKALFYILIGELVLGGGGRLTAFGPVSLRMILFGTALLTSAFLFLKGRRLPTDYNLLLLCFLGIICVGLGIGILSGANRVFWWEDVKPLLYFFILPFFYFAVTDVTVIERTSSLVKASSVIMAFSFFIVLILIHAHIIPFLSLYKVLIATDEFFFRGELTFTYKGFLFLCIGFLFVHFTGGKYKFAFMGILLLAILFTVTRGFWLALLATYAVYYFTKSTSSKAKSFAFVVLAIGIVAGGKALVGKTSQLIDEVKSDHTEVSNSPPKSTLLGDRNYSDEGRLQQIKEVATQVTFGSALWGHGFGNGVLSRPIHMEISYLEIFHKQGLLGLALWAGLFWLLITKYNVAQPGGVRDAFFFSSLFIFIQSLTNQYINNPIGLSMILLSLVCLDVLKKEVN